MRGVYNSVTDIRRKVFAEIAKMAYADHWELNALWKELKKDVFGQDSKLTLKMTWFYQWSITEL